MFGRTAKRKLGQDYVPSETAQHKEMPVAFDPGAQRKQDLWDYVEKFVREQKLQGPTDAWNPLVCMQAPGFMNGCADIVGYHKTDK